jgi:SsrA-binding protein
LQKRGGGGIIGGMSVKKGKEVGKTGAPTAVNKKAYHNFELVEKVEAGLGLMGSEVKSLRAGHADLSGSYARLDDNGEVWLVGANIAQYEQAGIYNHEPLRKRKLLLHKQQIHRIQTKLEQRGFTLVPLKIYFNQRGLAKVELALARGKRQYDKRATIADREQKRDVDREMRRRR